MITRPEIIITDCDLDGAATALLWKWISESDNINQVIKPTRVLDLSEKIISINNSIDISKCDVYIFDLDTSQCTTEALKIIDTKNFTIIDHHTSHVKASHIYNNATTHIEECTSCVKLLYKIYKDRCKNLSVNQKMLIGIVDDYDSYKLETKYSHSLNLIYWNYQGDRLQKFHEEYYNGFKLFDKKQQHIIQFYKNKIEKITSSLDVFHTSVSISSKPVNIYSAFASECINDVCQFLVDNFKTDIAMVVNLKSQKVSLRKSKKCNVPLDVLAKTIFTEGGGHADAAGGLMDDKFATFSKAFTPITE